MELIIAQSINNFSKFDKYLSKKVDILVFDQRVMVALDKKNINYLGVEDFYNADDYSVEKLDERFKYSRLALGYPYQIRYYVQPWGIPKNFNILPTDSKTPSCV